MCIRDSFLFRVRSLLPWHSRFPTPELLVIPSLSPLFPMCTHISWQSPSLIDVSLRYDMRCFLHHHCLTPYLSLRVSACWNYGFLFSCQLFRQYHQSRRIARLSNSHRFVHFFVDSKIQSHKFYQNDKIQRLIIHENSCNVSRFYPIFICYTALQVPLLLSWRGVRSDVKRVVGGLPRIRFGQCLSLPRQTGWVSLLKVPFLRKCSQYLIGEQDAKRLVYPI